MLPCVVDSARPSEAVGPNGLLDDQTLVCDFTLAPVADDDEIPLRATHVKTAHGNTEFY